MAEFKLKDLTREEVIDDVTVVYTGKSQNVPWEGGSHEDLGHKSEEIVEMYDSNGNRFYSNFESIEEANKAIAELAERGITAVVGPKAPWRGPDGNMIPNRFENAVGVFVVSVPEKSDDFFSPKTIYHDKYKMKHPRMVSFIRLICFSICLLISAGLIYTFASFRDDNDSLKTLKQKTFTPYKDFK